MVGDDLLPCLGLWRFGQYLDAFDCGSQQISMVCDDGGGNFDRCRLHNDDADVVDQRALMR